MSATSGSIIGVGESKFGYEKVKMYSKHSLTHIIIISFYLTLLYTQQ
jgi:hypothetical protein